MWIVTRFIWIIYHKSNENKSIRKLTCTICAPNKFSFHVCVFLFVCFFQVCDLSKIGLIVVIDAIATVDSSAFFFKKYFYRYFSCSFSWFVPIVRQYFFFVDNVFIASCFIDTCMLLNKIMVQNRKKREIFPLPKNRINRTLA